jgi:hypothetical protein
MGTAFGQSVWILLPTETAPYTRIEFSITQLRTHHNSYSYNCDVFKNEDIRYAFVPVERGYKHEYQ